MFRKHSSTISTFRQVMRIPAYKNTKAQIICAETAVPDLPSHHLWFTARFVSGMVVKSRGQVFSRWGSNKLMYSFRITVDIPLFLIRMQLLSFCSMFVYAMRGGNLHFEIILRASMYACVTVRSRGCMHDEQEQE